MSDAPAAAAPAGNIDYGEIPVRASVHSAQRSTPEELVQLGKKIWAEVQRTKVKKDDDRGNDALLEKFQNKYTDFNQSFPIVLRWMVQRREFEAGAFHKFLLKHAHAKLDTREAFLELQGEYLVLLYCATHPRYDKGFVKKYRDAVVKQLIDEDKEFTETQKQVDIEFEEKAKTFDADRRQRLYAFLLAQKLARGQNAATTATAETATIAAAAATTVETATATTAKTATATTAEIATATAATATAETAAAAAAGANGGDIKLYD